MRDFQNLGFTLEVFARIGSQPTPQLNASMVVVDGNNRARAGILNCFGNNRHTSPPRTLDQQAGRAGIVGRDDQRIRAVEQGQTCFKRGHVDRPTRLRYRNGSAHRAAVSTPEQTLFFQLGEVASRGDRRTIAMGANVLNRDDLMLLQKAQDDDVALGRKHTTASDRK